MTMNSDQALQELRFHTNRLEIAMELENDEERVPRVTCVCSRMHALLDELEDKESAGRTLRDSKGLSVGNS